VFVRMDSHRHSDNVTHGVGLSTKIRTDSFVEGGSMEAESHYYDLTYVLQMAARGSYLGFQANGFDHVAYPDELFGKPGSVTITHPRVFVDYGDGKYVEMRENNPKHHEFPLDAKITWDDRPNFQNGHVCINDALDIYFVDC